MKYSLICVDGADPMNRWCYAHLQQVKIERRFGDKHARIYVICEDGSEDVIDPEIWDCTVVVE